MSELEMCVHQIKRNKKSWNLNRKKIWSMLSAYRKSLENGESPAIAAKKSFERG